MTAARSVRGVLFDLDGVLIDSLAVMRLAFEASCYDVYGNDAGLDIEALFVEYRRHLGKGFGQIMRALGLSEELHPHFKAHSRALARYVHAYPGVHRMMGALAQDGWVMGVATGKDHARACELLEQLGLHAHLRLVLGCDSVASPKPAPDMAEIFMAHVGVPKHRLVMVGDAPADLECARRAGCRSVAAAWGFSAVDVLLQESPDHLAETPARLLEWLRALDLKEDCRS